MSRATVWRVLEAADLKPHKSVYWLNSHDPDFEAIAREVCGLYVQAPALHRQGHLLLCTDEKSGMQVLQRGHPTRPAIPGHPERRERFAAAGLAGLQDAPRSGRPRTFSPRRTAPRRQPGQ